MNEEQKASVKKKLLEIKACQQKYEEDMRRLRTELITHALYFETYYEMYSFIKSNTPTFKDFCIDMLEARELWIKHKGE